jgi:hypothetical protein
MPGRFLCQGHARGEPKFGVHVHQVRLHRAMRHEQARGDVFIAQPSLTSRTTSSSVGVNESQPFDGRFRSP